MSRAVNRYLIADAGRRQVPFLGMPFLHFAVGPNFVQLDVIAARGSSTCGPGSAALIAEPDHDSSDRLFFDSRQPARAADRIAFRQKPQNRNLLFAEEVSAPSVRLLRSRAIPLEWQVCMGCTLAETPVCSSRPDVASTTSGFSQKSPRRAGPPLPAENPPDCALLGLRRFPLRRPSGEAMRCCYPSHGYLLSLHNNRTAQYVNRFVSRNEELLLC